MDKTKLATAQYLAEKTGRPQMVIWHLGGYGVVSADEYSASEHGSAEKVVYPPKYQYPHHWEDVLQGYDPW